jgi:hypothetical protein
MTDLLAMAIGGAVADLIIAVYLGVRRYRTHHRVPHRKLRAAAKARRKLAAGISTPSMRPAAGPSTTHRGSAGASGVEPHPATGLPGTGPVAGPGLQASRPGRGVTAPQPAPRFHSGGHVHGRGSQLRTAVEAARRDPASATADAESQPAPGPQRGTLPGAGLNLRASHSARRGSAASPASGEPQPAPGSSSVHPGAGPELHADAAWIRAQAGQAGLNLRTKIQVWPPQPELIRDSAVTSSSVESQPAPGPLAGCGPQAGGRCRAPDMAPVATGAVSPSLAAPANRSAA